MCLGTKGQILAPAIVLVGLFGYAGAVEARSGPSHRPGRQQQGTQQQVPQQRVSRPDPGRRADQRGHLDQRGRLDPHRRTGHASPHRGRNIQVDRRHGRVEPRRDRCHGGSCQRRPHPRGFDGHGGRRGGFCPGGVCIQGGGYNEGGCLNRGRLIEPIDEVIPGGGCGLIGPEEVIGPDGELGPDGAFGPDGELQPDIEGGPDDEDGLYPPPTPGRGCPLR